MFATNLTDIHYSILYTIVYFIVYILCSPGIGLDIGPPALGLPEGKNRAHFSCTF